MFCRYTVCQFVTFTMLCKTVPSPKEFYIIDSTKTVESKVELKYDEPVSEKLGIVSCMSSVYFGERWQMYATSIEYNHYFGISRQVYYFMSALEGVYEILREYEKEKLIELRFWTIPDIPELHTLGEIWNRDQIGTLNDCFLRYREAADFIIVHDPDELMMFRGGPKLNNVINSLYTDQVAYVYLHGYRTFIHSAKTMATFDYASTVKSSKISTDRGGGKSIYRPAIIEDMDVHKTFHYRSSGSILELDPEQGIVGHLRNWEFHAHNNESFNVSG